jgi:inhibitor of cysteine peptidase
MKAGTIFVSVMMAILLGLVACSATKLLLVDSSSSGKEVTMAVGDTLTVTLESNVTTGYSWTEYCNIDDAAVIQQIDHIYQSPATPIPGAGGKEVWTFKALKAGKSRI